MIQIYSVNNTNYEKNGDALLPSSASVHVILNGAWEAELNHPIDKEGRWKNIVEEAVVKMPSFNGDQLFRIKAVEKQDSGVTATMEPIFYDAMNDCFLEDIRPNGDNGQTALAKMLSPNNKYSASSNITKTATAYYQYVNFLEALNGDLDQSFIKRWGGEILFDNYTVIVNEHVGGDYGAELRYGKNIPKNGMSFDVDNRDIVTRIYPKAYEGRMMSNNGYVDSPLINNYPTVKAATMTFENVKLSSDLQGDPEDTDIVCDTQAELDQALEEMCEAQFSEGLDKPKVTISVDMVLLQNTEQYKDVKGLEEVSLGDTVRIYNWHLGIMSEARIIELEYDAIRKKVSSVVIGDYEYNYFNEVSSATEIIKNVVNPDGTLMAERVQGILNGVYTQLRLQSTAAQKVDGVAFKVEELDDESPLYGCMIWGTQGIQISTTRTADGKDWDWTTAITAKGIVANAIITGLLSDKTGNNYWDLDTGEFRLSSTYVKIDGDNIGDYVDSTLTQQEVFDKLTNNGQAQGIILQNGQLYINAEYIQSLILKVGGVNNENGTFEVYNGSGVLVGKIDKDGAKFTNGNDWLQIKNSLMTGGYGGTTDGLLDLSANYSGGERHVVLESKTGDVILKSANEFKVERPSVGQGILVQSGSADFIEEGIGIIFGAVTPLAAIALAKSVSEPYLVLKTWDGSDGYDRYEFLEGDKFSYSHNYAFIGYEIRSVNSGTSINPGGSTRGLGFGVSTSLRDSSYEYICVPITTGWGAVGSITQPTPYNGYYCSITMVNNGSSAHSLGAQILVLVYKPR